MVAITASEIRSIEHHLFFKWNPKNKQSEKWHFSSSQGFYFWLLHKNIVAHEHFSGMFYPYCANMHIVSFRDSNNMLFCGHTSHTRLLMYMFPRGEKIFPECAHEHPLAFTSSLRIRKIYYSCYVWCKYKYYAFFHLLFHHPKKQYSSAKQGILHEMQHLQWRCIFMFNTKGYFAHSSLLCWDKMSPTRSLIEQIDFRFLLCSIHVVINSLCTIRTKDTMSQLNQTSHIAAF